MRAGGGKEKIVAHKKELLGNVGQGKVSVGKPTELAERVNEGSRWRKRVERERNCESGVRRTNSLMDSEKSQRRTENESCQGETSQV